MKSFIIFLILSISFLSLTAQEIAYSKPRHDDLLFGGRYDIIGKLNDNVLIYKHIRYKHLISIYDNKMKLKEDINLKFIPSNVISVEFVNCFDRVDLIYQFQKRNVFYCMAAAIDGNGKIIHEPIQLDTSHIKFLADLKLYHVSSSEDRSKIMVYKIDKGDFYTGSGLFHFTTLLFNESLHLIHKSEIESFFETEKDLFSDFLVDNDGNFVFAEGTKLETTDLFEHLVLVTKGPTEDNFNIHTLDLSGNLLDGVDLKIDNLNKNYLINSSYYKKRNGDKEGPYTAIWSKRGDSLLAKNFFSFAGVSTLNYFYLRNVILTKDGGFIVAAEDLGIQGHYLFPWPENFIFSSAQYVFSSIRFLSSSFYKNVVILYFDNKAHLKWSNEIIKSQTGRFPSFAVINTGNSLHFLFNEIERQTEIMKEQTLSSDGDLSNKTPLSNLDLNYQLEIHGKQVSSSETIFPCVFRGYICFAKVKY